MTMGTEHYSQTQNRGPLGYSRSDFAWAGLIPFFVFALCFEVLPICVLLISSLTDRNGLTLANYEAVFSLSTLAAFRNSLQLSLSTALLGAALGTIVAYALVTSPSPTVRNGLTALADVTANFGGAPLAFAFIITLGSSGVVTLLLQAAGVNLYPEFRIYSVAGLTVAYVYFQLPLFILLILPALLGLRREWREAATSLGASAPRYWLHVGLPILDPSLLGSFLLLFANAFGAYATAWTLTGSDVNLVTVQIAALIRGEVQFEPGRAEALAIISLVVMALCVFGYHQLSARARNS